jgi:hypothetical protein
MAPVVEAYQALRGASFLVAEIGDVRRFDTPRQLMAFLGLVPAERSTGDTVRRKGLTLAGNRRARRALIEAAWTYRYPARVSETLRARLEGLPKSVRDIAWKAQVRLCARYRRLSATVKWTRAAGPLGSVFELEVRPLGVPFHHAASGCVCCCGCGLWATRKRCPSCPQLRWFATCSCKPIGGDLPPSLTPLPAAH